VEQVEVDLSGVKALLEKRVGDLERRLRADQEKRLEELDRRLLKQWRSLERSNEQIDAIRVAVQKLADISHIHDD